MDKILRLKDCIGCSSEILIVLTSKKKDSIKKIRLALKEWMLNKTFSFLKSSLIDLSIVVYLDSISYNRYNKQDLDNISKVVLDALSKDKKDVLQPYLFENDSQVVIM